MHLGTTVQNCYQDVYWVDQLLWSPTSWWHSDGQDVWGGITRFINAKMLQCTTLPSHYMLHKCHSITLPLHRVSITLHPTHHQIFWGYKIQSWVRAAATAYGAPSFPCSYFIDQYSSLPNCSISLNAPQFGAFRLFLMKCHNSNLYEAGVENIWPQTGTNVTPVGGFEKCSSNKFHPNSILMLWRMIWSVLGFNFISVFSDLK